MSNFHEVNNKIFDLLKEPLQLHEKCIDFTLECGIDQYPRVTEFYYCDIDHMVKILEHKLEEKK